LNVRTLCLGFLSTREATGYEIKKEFEEGLFSHFIEASYGSIYPALNQLAADGLVTVREEEQSGKPDRKVYAITTKGHGVLSQWLSVVPARDKYKSEFLFQMLLQHYLSPRFRIEAAEKQLADVIEDLEGMAECRAKAATDPGAAFVMGYGEAILLASKTYLEREIPELRRQANVAAE
jgi:PadR family transcriptional regulator, regulatory protein AphA